MTFNFQCKPNHLRSDALYRPLQHAVGKKEGPCLLPNLADCFCCCAAQVPVADGLCRFQIRWKGVSRVLSLRGAVAAHSEWAAVRTIRGSKPCSRDVPIKPAVQVACIGGTGTHTVGAKVQVTRVRPLQT